MILVQSVLVKSEQLATGGPQAFKVSETKVKAV